MKRKATGEYLASSSFSFTDVKTRAWGFCINEPVTYTADQVNANAENQEIESWVDATVVDVYSRSDKPQLIFTDQSCQNDTSVTKRGNVKYLVTNGAGKAAGFGNNVAQNTWELYQVIELTGAAYLQDAMDEIFPGGSADLYNVGSEPGQISETLYNELTGSYEAAQNLITEGSTDQEACVAAADRCVKAIEAAKNGAVKIGEGYYFFRGNRTENNCTWEENGLRWNYNQDDWFRPEVLDLANAKYVWQLIADKEAEGAYFIQSFWTKRYISIPAGKGQPVPTTDEPEESFLIYPRTKDDFTIQSTTLKANPLVGWNGEELTALHQAGDHNGVVAWVADNENSGWRFLSVSMEEINNLADLIDQAKLNEIATAELANAENTYNSGFFYEKYVKSVDNVWANATEPSEGSLLGAIDGDPNTMYHTEWSVSDHSDQMHYLAADLGEAVQNVKISIVARQGGGGPSDSPTLIQLYGTNSDPCLEDGTENPDFTGWVQIESTDEESQVFVYNQPIVVKGVSKANQKAVVDFDLGAAYRYLKLEPVRRGTTDLTPGMWWNCGDILITGNELKEGLIQAVPSEVRTRLENAIKAVKEQLEAEKATQTAIDELQAALEDFIANYPDPTRATKAIAAAKAQHEAAEESEDGELGYYQVGAKAEFLGAIEAQEAKIKDIMTVVEVNDVIEAIDNAIAIFNSKLNKPAADKYYYVKSLTSSEQEGSAIDSYLYAAGNSARVKWEQPSNVDLSTMPQMIWKLVATDKGYVLQNAFTGEYMNNPKLNNAAVTMSTDADTCSFAIVGASAAGAFNLVMDKGVFANAQPGTNNLVTWGAAEGFDNSAFTFVEANLDNYEGFFTVALEPNAPQIITFSVDVDLIAADCCYKVLGRKDNTIQLATFEGELKAGTPVILIEESGLKSTEFASVAESFSEISDTWATEAKEMNGLMGTLAGQKVRNGYGILYDGVFVDSENESVANNSGYLLPTVPATQETGDAEILIDGNIDGIDNVVIFNKDGQNADVYNLNGVKVRSNVKSANDLNGLPAGLYIMGGQKILVK